MTGYPFVFAKAHMKTLAGDFKNYFLACHIIHFRFYKIYPGLISPIFHLSSQSVVFRMSYFLTRTIIVQFLGCLLSSFVDVSLIHLSDS